MLGATVPDYSLDDDETIPVNSITENQDGDLPGEVVKTKEVLDWFTD